MSGDDAHRVSRRSVLRTTAIGAGGFVLGAGAGYTAAPADEAREPPSETGGPDVDARDFGVKADGSTVDAAALQRAIDGGGTIRLPAGVVDLGDERLTLHGSAQLVGVGPTRKEIGRGTRLTFRGEGPAIAVNDGEHGPTQGMAIRNLTLDGGGTGAMALRIGSRDGNPRSARGVVENVIVTGASERAVEVVAAQGFSFRSLAVVDNAGDGTVLATGGANTTTSFDGCVWSQNRRGLIVEDARDIVFRSCTAETNREEGVVVREAKDGRIVNLVFESLHVEGNISEGSAAAQFVASAGALVHLLTCRFGGTPDDAADLLFDGGSYLVWHPTLSERGVSIRGSADVAATTADDPTANWRVERGATATFQRVGDAGHEVYAAVDGEVVPILSVRNGQLAFFGADPVVRQTVRGKRGSAEAITSAVSALAALGLVVDETT